MEAKPIQSAPFSASGGGTRKNNDVDEQAESPSVKLGLGIISAGHGAAVIKQGKPFLTAAQLDELQRQLVIYEYLAGGLRVPSSLVRPIWKSVVGSLRDSNGVSGIHRRHPSFVGFSKEFDYTNMMDPEPERCRRTDGKRWRCRKNVVSGQKYCEQHMHRGRRSRKSVGSSQIITTSDAIPLNNSSKNFANSHAYSFYSAPETNPSDTSLSHKNSGAAIGNADLKIMGMNMTVGVVSGSESISTSIIHKGTTDCINAAAIAHTVHTDTTIQTATVGTNRSGNSNCKSNSIDDSNGNCSKYVSLKNQIDCGNNSTNINDATSQGLKFSPKSVLQVQGCNSTYICRSEGELEPRRCRRTDGKKWRCRRDAVPNEKYCKIHMHRGAKKRVMNCQSPAPLKAAPNTSTSSRLNPMSVLPNNVDSLKLNINLSISISANPRLQTKENKNPSDATISSGSDATISDTVIAKCDDRDVSS